MNNQQGFTTLVALELQRDCFSSEMDRLTEYAKSLRVPIQTGEIIKGDPGEKGDTGNTGPAGAKGADGVDGATPAMTATIEEIDAAVDNWTVSGDIRNKIVNLVYDDLALDPPSLINIMCLRFDGTDTTVYFSAVTPDDKFRLRIVSY